MVTNALGDKLAKFEKAQVLIEPQTVADYVIQQLHSGSSGQIIIPERQSLAAGLRGWALWLQLVVRNRLNKGVVEFNMEAKQG